MNTSKLISIVVPVYNVQNYLCECVGSLLNQTYQNIEVILVDDGATDNCPQICDMYAENYENVSVIHKKNGGLSDARNVGLRSAKGEYIIFIDSDDYIDKKMLELLYGAAENNKASVSTCEYRKLYNKPVVEVENVQTTTTVLKGKDIIKELYLGNYSNIGFVAWNKLYRTELFIENNIEYPFGRIYEDTFTTYKLLYHADEVAIVNSPLYNYRIRPGSIMKSSLNMKKCRDYFDACRSAVDFFENNSERELFNLALNAFFRSQIFLYNELRNNKQDDCIKQLMLDYEKAYLCYKSKINAGVLKKIIYKLFIYCPELIRKLYKRNKLNE